MTDPANSQPVRFTFSLPLVLALTGIVMVGLSFLPIGNFFARSQWTPENSATYDRISREYKEFSLKSPERQGVSQQEWEQQRAKMQQQMSALQGQLETAKSQPELWSRYLLGIGVLLAVAGLYANAANRG